MFKKYSIIFILLFSFVLAENAYKIDSSHSSIDFEVGHLKIGKVKGKFTDFEGDVTVGDKGITSINISGKTQSIDTSSKKRDGHLRNADFFEVETYPTINLVLKSYKGNRKKGKLKALLTIKDVTKEVVLNVKISDEITNPIYKNKVVAITLNTTINRLDFNIGSGEKYSAKFPIGHDVDIEFNLEANR